MATTTATPTATRRDPAALRALIAALESPTRSPAPIDVTCADCGYPGLWRPGDGDVHHGEQACRVRQQEPVARARRGRGRR